ncbi:MAG TPA: hypothetical protein PLD30_10045 [Candidatus Competibacteraceae bacterium]|nr:hypothetical protein [Candidatus Competibacteraceae bacterium]
MNFPDGAALQPDVEIIAAYRNAPASVPIASRVRIWETMMLGIKLRADCGKKVHSGGLPFVMPAGNGGTRLGLLSEPSLPGD